MELGLPNLGGIDIIGAIMGFFQFLISVVMGAWWWLVGAVGGNMFAAGIIVFFIIYVISDLIYHKFIDIPAAQAGGFVTGFAIKAGIFIMVLIVVFTFMYMGV